MTTDHCYTIAKINEWYASSVTITAKQKDCKGIKIHRHSPATTVKQGSYTSGFTWNLAGDVGCEGNSEGTVTGHINVSGGISFSESTTYPLHDVTVTNLTDPTGKLCWSYTFAYPRYGFSLFSVASSWIENGALAGRSTYNAGQDYLISFPESERKPALSADFKVELRSSAIKCGAERGVWKLSVESEVANISLPYMCTDNFKN